MLHDKPPNRTATHAGKGDLNIASSEELVCLDVKIQKFYEKLVAWLIARRLWTDVNYEICFSMHGGWGHQTEQAFS